MFYIGIDPGEKGGIAVINGDDPTFYKVYMYAPERLRAVCTVYHDNSMAWIENVHAMRGQGVTSMFTFGKGFGYILGTLDAYGIPCERVEPRTWQKTFAVHSKSDSIEKAKKLFPGINLKPRPRMRKDQDGMSDAILIAEYGRRMMK